jgi:spermidine synthase
MGARFFVYGLFFASGGSGLIYQIVWMRRLALVFGSSIFATTLVLTCFMGGLALGSFYFGRSAETHPQPLKLYAKLEFGIAASTGLLMFLILPLMDASYVALTHVFAPTQNPQGVFLAHPVTNIARFLLAAVLLLVPTTLMGGTLPVMSRHFVGKAEEFGVKIAMLYALNTLGAMAACVVTGFYLIRIFGENITVLIAISINLFVGLAAHLYARRQAPLPIEKPAETPPSKPSFRVRAALCAFGLAGFTSLAYEVIWFRALYNSIGFHVYTVTVILAAFLFGLTLGSLLIARFVDRIKHLYLSFGLIEIAIAALAIASLPLLDHTPTWSQSFFQQLADMNLFGDAFTLNNLAHFSIAFSIFAIPTVLMGAVFPIVNKIYQTEQTSVSRNVGNVYSANTLGTIMGSACAGFLFLPYFGVAGSLFLIASVNLCLGVILSFLEPSDPFSRRCRVFALFSAAATVIATLTFQLHQGVPHYLQQDNEAFTMPFYKETLSATLAVKEYTHSRNIWGYPVRKLCINNACTAHSTQRDVSVHKVLAHTPALLHPKPQRALIIGFGLGSTAYSMLQHDDLKVDCVEILKEETETAPFFARENRSILSAQANFQLFIEDGRNYLLSTTKTYDIVSVNAIAPRFSPALYTRDFFELSQSKMNSNGIMAIWLPTYSVSKAAYRSIFQSFRSVFPSSFLFYVNHSHYLLIGSAQDIEFDLDEFARRAETERIQDSLKEVGLEDPLVLLSTVIMTPAGFESWLKDAPQNTDQNPIAEFDTEEQPGMPFNPDLMADTLMHYSKLTPYVVGDAAAVIQLERYSTQVKHWISAQYEHYSAAQGPAVGMAQMLKTLNGNSSHPFLDTLMATYGRTEINRPYFQPHYRDFLKVLERVRVQNPALIQVHDYMASTLVKLNELQSAATHRKQVMQARPKDWLFAFNYGLDQLNLDQVEAAAETYSRLSRFEHGAHWGHFGLALIAQEAKDFPRARRELQKALDRKPDFPEAQNRLRELSLTH